MNSVCIKKSTKHNSKKIGIMTQNATLLTQLFMSLQSRNNGNMSDFFNMKIIVSPLIAECSMLMLNPCSRYGCFYSHRTFSSCTNNDYIHLYEESNANDEIRSHCPTDTGFEIRALAVSGRARSFAVMRAPVLHTILTSDHYE